MVFQITLLIINKNICISTDGTYIGEQWFKFCLGTQPAGPGPREIGS